MQAILDVAETIVTLSSLPACSVLHCDVSPGNVLVSPDGRGLLIDFGSALMGSGGEHCVTGTPLFSAFSVLWGEANTLSSDLESLFYTLLSIALDGEVSEGRSHEISRMIDCKLTCTIVQG